MKGFKITKELSLSQKIFWGSTFISSFILLLFGSIMYYSKVKSNEREHRLENQRRQTAVWESFEYLISSELVDRHCVKNVIEKRLFEIADIHNLDINVYSIDGDLLLTTEAEKKTTVKKLSPKLIHDIFRNRFINLDYLDKERNTSYTSHYFYVMNNKMLPVAIINLPYFYDNDRAKEEFNSILTNLSIAFAFVLILSIFFAYFFSKTVTQKIQEVSKKIRQTSILNQNKQLNYSGNDEIKPLVEAYNQMIQKLDEQTTVIAQMEREQAWKEMARQVAHEIKNPLTPMKLMIQNFAQKFDKNDPDIEKKLKQLSDSLIQQIEIIASITESFSHFAHFPERFDEKLDLVEETKKIVMLFDQSISFETSLKKCDYLMDRGLFSRMLTNLIKNAQQSSSKPDNLKIVVRLSADDKHYIFEIEDNGNGIPTEIVPKIFEPKFTTKAKGMGLGLPMVKKIVEEYGGEVSYTPNPKGGSIFKIVLPK